jgi:hypothetical protein
VEDGLAVGGGEWAGAETGQVGVVVFAEKVQGGDAVEGKVGVVGEDGGRGAQEMVSGEQEAVALVVGSGGEEDAAADGFEQGRRWGWWVQGVGDGCAEGADEEDGAGGLLGEFGEGREGMGEARDGTGGIEDEQASIQEADGGGELW